MQFWVRKNIIICMAILFSITIISQNNSTDYKYLIIPPNIDSIVLDSASINPNTLIIKTISGAIISPLSYQINPINSKLYFLKKQSDSISISYQLLKLNFINDYFFHDSTLMNRQKTENYTPIRIKSNKTNNDVFNGTQLNKTGSLSRGIMLGNNQNFSLNSNLNLQLSGNISPDLKILASVTDANIPIQPQGNTQQLQDFDQVFIKVLHKNWNLLMGDF